MGDKLAPYRCQYTVTGSPPTRNKTLPSLVSPFLLRSFPLAVLMCCAALAQAPAVRQFLLRIEPVRCDFRLQNMTAEETPVVREHAGQVFDPQGFRGILVVNAPDSRAARANMNDDAAIGQPQAPHGTTPVRVPPSSAFCDD